MLESHTLEVILQVVAVVLGLLFILGVVVPEVVKALTSLPSVSFDDPVTQCQCYVEQGCSHVDGMHCEMKSCTILKDYRKSDT